MSDSFVAEIIDRFATTQAVKLVPIKVVTESPLSVNLNGDTTTDVPARSLTGDTLTVGATGFALWAPPLSPLAFTATVDDTGWVNLTYESGFSAGTPGQLAYRRIGNRVTLRGGATRSGNFASGAALDTVAFLPSSTLYPVSTVRVGVTGASRKPAALEIVSTTGAVQMAVASEIAAVSWISANTSYLID